MSKIVLGSATYTIVWSLYDDGTLVFSSPENAEIGNMKYWRSSFSCRPGDEYYLKQMTKIIKFDSKKIISFGDDASDMFKGFPNLEKITFDNVDTSNVVDFSYMFKKCKNLRKINGINNINTGKGKYFNDMFSESGIMDLDISSWDLSSAEYMRSMCYKCNYLMKFKANNSSSKMLKSMYCMFGYCRNLRSVEMNGWDVTSLQDCQSMYQGCENLETLAMDNWKASEVSDVKLKEMFDECEHLEEVNIGSLNSTPQNYKDVFRGCRNLKKITVPDDFDVYESNLNSHPERTEAVYEGTRVYKKYTGRWAYGSPYNHTQTIGDDEFLNSVIPGGTWCWEQND